MGEVATTLKVPAEQVAAFRLAVLDEIEIDAGAINRKEDAADIRSHARLLSADLHLLQQVNESVDGRELEVHSDAETLAHAAETMAEKVVGPKLMEELQTSPIDPRFVSELRPLIESLSWAIERAGQFHEQWAAAHGSTERR